MHRGIRDTRQALPEHAHRVSCCPETVPVSIPCQFIKRLFAEGTSIIINLRAVPDFTPVNLPRPVSRASSSWSTVHPTEEGGPPSYQAVTEGRIECKQIDPEMPPLEDMAINEQSGHKILQAEAISQRKRLVLWYKCCTCFSLFSKKERT